MPDDRLDPYAYGGFKSSYLNEFSSPASAASRAASDAKSMVESGSYIAASAVSNMAEGFSSAASVAYSGSAAVARDFMRIRNTMSPPASAIPSQFTQIGSNQYQPGLFESVRAKMGMYLQAPRGMTQAEYERMASIRLGESIGSAGFEIPATLAEFAAYDLPINAGIAGFAAGGLGGALLGGGIGALVAAPLIGGISKARATLRSRRQVRNSLRTESWRFARGTGFSERQVQGLSRDLVGMASDFSGVAASDIGNLVSTATDLGMFDMSRTPDDVAKKFKDVLKKVDTIVKQMDVSADEAIMRLGSGNKALIQPWTYRGMGRAAGLTVEELSRAGQESAAMFRGTGISSGWAFDLGAQTLANARNLQLSGARGSNIVSGLGGLAATQEKMMQAQGQFMRTPQMALMIGAFANAQGALDPNQLMQFMSQGGGTEGLLQTFTSNLAANQGDIAWQSKLNMRMQENINKINPQQFNILMTKSLINDARSMVGERAWKDLDKEGRIAIATQAVAPGAYGIDPRTARAAIESLDPGAYERQFMQQIRETQRQSIIMRERGSGVVGFVRKAYGDLSTQVGEGAVGLWDRIPSVGIEVGSFLRNFSDRYKALGVAYKGGAIGALGDFVGGTTDWAANLFESGASSSRTASRLNIVYSKAETEAYESLLKEDSIRSGVENVMRSTEDYQRDMTAQDIRTEVVGNRLKKIYKKGSGGYGRARELIGYEVQGYEGKRFKGINSAVDFVTRRYKEDKALPPEWVETNRQSTVWSHVKNVNNWKEVNDTLTDINKSDIQNVIRYNRSVQWDKLGRKITINELSDRAARGSEDAARFLSDKIDKFREVASDISGQNFTHAQVMSVMRDEVMDSTRDNLDAIFRPSSITTLHQSKKIEENLTNMIKNLNIGTDKDGKTIKMFMLGDNITEKDIQNVIESGGVYAKWVEASERGDKEEERKYRLMLNKKGIDEDIRDRLSTGFGANPKMFNRFKMSTVGLWNYRMNVAWNQNLQNLSFKGIGSLQKWFEKGGEKEFGAKVAKFAERLSEVSGDRQATMELMKEPMGKEYLEAIARAGSYGDFEVSKTARRLIGGLSATTAGAIVDAGGVSDAKAYMELLKSTATAVENFGTTMATLTKTLEKIGD